MMGNRFLDVDGERWLDIEERADSENFLPALAYSDPEFFELEMRTAFGRAWVFAGDLAELAHPGQYITVTVGRDPVMVVRDETGELQAFGNVCLHRAATLLRESGNCGHRIVCPYHGWTYDLAGRVRGIPQRDAFCTPLNPEKLALPRVRVGSWNRFVFVNLSDDAEDLLNWLETVPALLAPYDLEGLEPGPGTQTTYPFNWKTVMDNNLDGYHIPMAHHETIHRRLEAKGIEMGRGPKNTSTGSYPMRLSTLTDMGSDRAQLPGDLQTRSLMVAVYPTLIFSADPGGSFFVTSITPLAVDRTKVSVRTYARRGAFATNGEAGQQAAAEGTRIMDEDYAVCLGIEQGLRSRFYQGGPVHNLELQSQGLHRWLIRNLGVASPQGVAVR
jgi:choline monooxygenase